jgi:hypothetical protein
MAETKTERAIRLKQEREERKSQERKMTTRQAAFALVHRRLSTYEITPTELALFLRKTKVSEAKVEAVNKAAAKVMEKWLQRLAKVAGEENV